MLKASPQKKSTHVVRKQQAGPRKSRQEEHLLALQIGENQEPKAAESFLVQPKLSLGAVDSPLEQEADQVAQQVVHKQQKAKSTGSSSEPIQTKKEQKTPSIQMKAAGKSTPGIPAGFAIDLQSVLHLGKPLQSRVRQEMETAFAADFSQVMIHEHAQAAALCEFIQAYAFTYQNHIFFNQGQFQPHTLSGTFLLAHELTHILQQGSVALGAPGPTLDTENDHIQASFKDALHSKIVDILNYFGLSPEEIIQNIPGYYFFAYTMGYDIFRRAAYARTPKNLVQASIGLLPFGELLFRQMEKYQVIDKGMLFLSDQLKTFDLSQERIQAVLEAAYQEMTLLKGLGGNLQILQKHFARLYESAKAFLIGLSGHLVHLIKEALLLPLGHYLHNKSPAYKLLTKILKLDPISAIPIVASTEEILADFLVLISRNAELEEMKKHGLLKKAAQWLNSQFVRFFELKGKIYTAFQAEWAMFDLARDLQNPEAAFSRLLNRFGPLVNEVFQFGYEVAAKALSWIKEILLNQLKIFAQNTKGYTLLTVILGKDPITQEVIEQTALKLVEGFMTLLPDGAKRYKEIEESGVIPSAIEKIWALVEGLGLSWENIRQQFIGLWNSFSIADLLDPIMAFTRIIQVFKSAFGSLAGLIGNITFILIEALLVMMGMPTDLMASLLGQIQLSLGLIKTDPIGFMRNLLQALKMGFAQFFDNMLGHLSNGIGTWFTNTLKKAGIEAPEELSLASIFSSTLQVLGISRDNIMMRLEEKIGPEKMAQIREVTDSLTGVWTFVKDVRDRGIVAIFDYISEQIQSLWQIVMSGIQNWLQNNLIVAAAQKILSMLEPTGISLIIQSFIAFFKAVQSLVDQLVEILKIIQSFFNGVADIAKGSLKTAADFLETGLADGIPVALAFLAKQLGIEYLGVKLKEMLEEARVMINLAIDWLIEKAAQSEITVKKAAKSILEKTLPFFGIKTEVKVEVGKGAAPI
jgi:hypothetical protein